MRTGFELDADSSNRVVGDPVYRIAGLERLLDAAPTFNALAMHGAAARLRRALAAGGDVLLLVVIAFCIPFAILAIGIPIALFIQLLLWLVRLV